MVYVYVKTYTVATASSKTGLPTTLWAPPVHCVLTDLLSIC